MPPFPKTDENKFTRCKLTKVEYLIEEAERQNPKKGQDKHYVKHVVVASFNCLSYQPGNVVSVRVWLNQIRSLNPNTPTGEFLEGMGWLFDTSLDSDDLNDDDVTKLPSEDLLEGDELDNPDAIVEEIDHWKPIDQAKEIEKFLSEKIGKQYLVKVKPNKKSFPEFVSKTFKEVPPKQK